MQSNIVFLPVTKITNIDVQNIIDILCHRPRSSWDNFIVELKKNTTNKNVLILSQN